MKNLIKRIFVLGILLVPCTSCVDNPYRLHLEDFHDFFYTKWIREDEGFTFYVEGKDYAYSNFGYYANDDSRYRVDIGEYLTSAYLRIQKCVNDETDSKEYRIEKVLKNKKWDGKIRAINVDRTEEYYFFPHKIEVTEINPNHFRDISLVNAEQEITFQYRHGNNSSQTNSWIYIANEQIYTLTFGENHTFKIEGNMISNNGTYIPNYGSMELIFEEEFFDSKKMILNYCLGYEFFDF